MRSEQSNDGVTLKELEDALKVVAYCVLRCGTVYAPILERLEREVEMARQQDPMMRARRILAAYTDEGARKAIRLSQSALLSNE